MGTVHVFGNAPGETKVTKTASSDVNQTWVGHSREGFAGQSNSVGAVDEPMVAWSNARDIFLSVQLRAC